MPMIDFSEQNLLANKILTPGWYKINIDEVEDWKIASTGTSSNCVMNCTVLENADTHETEGIAGVPVLIRFNDSPKARVFMVAFLKALGVDVEANTRYDLKAAEGKQIVAFVENSTYQDRVRNDINHKYRAISA